MPAPATPSQIIAAQVVPTVKNKAAAVAALKLLEHFEEWGDESLGDLVDTALRGGVRFNTASPESFISTPPGSPRLEALNREWFLMLDAGRLSVARWVEDPLDDKRSRQRIERISTSDFEKLHQTESAARGLPLGRAWMEWPGRRLYDRVLFDPRGTHPASTLNLWRGWAVKPAPGDWSAIREHIEQVICNGVAEYSDYLLRWMASLFQRPGVRAGVVPVLRGPEGAGKSVLGAAIRRVTGQHGILVSSPGHVVGRFNSHLRDLCFLEASEAMFAGDRAAASKLKSMITDDSMVLEGKGRDAVTVPNRTSMLFTTNDDWAVPAGPESRRYFVLDVPGTKLADEKYFDALWSRVNDDAAIAAMLHDLLAVDLSSFNIRRFPVTEALVAQREHSLTGVNAWLLDLIERQRELHGDGMVRMSTTALVRDQGEWAGHHKYERTLSGVVIGRALKALGVPGYRVQSGNGFELRLGELEKRVREAAGIGRPAAQEAPALAVEAEDDHPQAQLAIKVMREGYAGTEAST